MSHRIFTVSFWVENCPSKGITKCEICAIHFPKGEIRIVHRRNMRRNLHYHLNCYSPKVPQYIKSSDICNCLKPESIPIFDEWLKNWNSKFFALDNIPIISVIPQKSLHAISLSRKRTLIEVFKFLPISIVTSALPFVSKEFYQVCWDSELWQTFLLRDFKVSEVSSESKKKYIELYNNVCIECKIIPSESMFYRCPLLKKNICKICLNTEKFRLMNRSDILKFFGVDSKLLNINYGTSMHGKKLAYAFKVKNEVYKLRENHKGKILEMSQVFGDDHEFLQLIKNIDVTNLDHKQHEHKFAGRYIYQEQFDESIKWSFFIDIQFFIRTGKGRITKDKLIKEVNKKFKIEDSN